MSPVDRFFTLLQFRLNQVQKEEGVIVLLPERSRVELETDGSVIEIPQIFYICLGGIPEIRDVVSATLSALAEVGTKVWADWQHREYRIGRQGLVVRHACVSDCDENQGDRFVLVTVLVNDGFVDGMTADWSPMSPPNSSFHDESAEIRAGQGEVAKMFRV